MGIKAQAKKNDECEFLGNRGKTDYLVCKPRILHLYKYPVSPGYQRLHFFLDLVIVFSLGTLIFLSIQLYSTTHFGKSVQVS